MKQDSPGDVGDGLLEENQIIRNKIILIQFQKMLSIKNKNKNDVPNYVGHLPLVECPYIKPVKPVSS